MRIDLTKPLPQGFVAPEGYTAVGMVDDGILAYDVDRLPSKLTWGRMESLDPAEVNLSLRDAVQEAGLRIWPGGFSYAFPLAFGLNRRTTQADRIIRSGLNPRIIGLLGKMASSPNAKELGLALTTISHVSDICREKGGRVEDIIREAYGIYTSVRQGRTTRPEASPSVEAPDEIAEEEAPQPAM